MDTLQQRIDQLNNSISRMEKPSIMDSISMPESFDKNAMYFLLIPIITFFALILFQPKFVLKDNNKVNYKSALLYSLCIPVYIGLIYTIMKGNSK